MTKTPLLFLLICTVVFAGGPMDLCPLCSNCDFGTCYSSGERCYMMYQNNQCEKIYPGDANRNIDMADLRFPCLVIEEDAAFYGRITGTDGNDCLVVGPGALLESDVDLRGGDDAFFVFPETLHRGDITMGSGNDCYLPFYHAYDGSTINMGSGNDMAIPFLFITYAAQTEPEFILGSGDDCLIFNIDVRDISGGGKRNEHMGMDSIVSMVDDPAVTNNFFMDLLRMGLKNVTNNNGGKRYFESDDETNYDSEDQATKREGPPGTFVGDIKAGSGDDCVFVAYTILEGEVKGQAGNDCIFGRFMDISDDILGGKNDDIIDIMYWGSNNNDALRFRGGPGNDYISVTNGPPGLEYNHEINGQAGNDFCCDKHYDDRKRSTEGGNGVEYSVRFVRNCETQCPIPTPP